MSNNRDDLKMGLAIAVAAEVITVELACEVMTSIDKQAIGVLDLGPDKFYAIKNAYDKITGYRGV